MMTLICAFGSKIVVSSCVDGLIRAATPSPTVRHSIAFMNRLIPINSESDIPAHYRGTSVGLLLGYHNFEKPYETYSSAQLLIGMCMDNRKHLHIPDNFAYIIRSGGANLRYSEFKVSYAIAVGGAKAIALIGHTQCGMVNLIARKEQFVRGLVERAGWQAEQAEEHFHHLSLIHI